MEEKQAPEQAQVQVQAAAPQPFLAATSVNVEWPLDGAAPAPIFASVCNVARFQDHLTIDFGYVEPFQTRQVGEIMNAKLRHVGRVFLPETTAKRLIRDMAAALGMFQPTPPAPSPSPSQVPAET